MSSYRAPSRRLSRLNISRTCAENTIRLAFDGRPNIPANEFLAAAMEAIVTQQQVEKQIELMGERSRATGPANCEFTGHRK